MSGSSDGDTAAQAGGGRYATRVLHARLRLRFAIVVLLALPCCTAVAERIKKRPPTPAEAERIASDVVMNDSLLQKGDIVVTDHGFLLYRGVGADGVAGDFLAVPNPLSTPKSNLPRGQ
jgi:hypothetical protein